MKNKLLKITSFVLAIAFALSMVVYAEESDVITMTVGSVSVEQADGEAIVEVPITVEGEMDVTALQVNVSFLEALTCVEYIAGDSLKDITEPALKSKTISMPFASADPVKMKNGTFATLKFKVAADEVAVYPIDLYVIEAFDGNYEDASSHLKTVSGKITVGNPADYDGSIPSDGSDELRKDDAIFMCIGESASFVNGKKTLIDPANKQVVPYIKNERTLVPLRFVSESIGAEVLWEDGWDYCLIKKDGKEIKITFGSAEFEVNGEKFTYEAPIETVYDRTMVPVRFISEHLGYNVYWQELNQAVVITPENNPWIEGRNAEKTALVEVIVSIKGILP